MRRIGSKALSRTLLLALGVAACGGKDDGPAGDGAGDADTLPETAGDGDAPSSLDVPAPEPEPPDSDAAGDGADTASPEVSADDAAEIQDVDPDAGADGDDATPEPPPECTSATAALDCDDGVACTIDECNSIQGKCLHTFEDNHCCLSAADCKDGDACTADVCAANRCVHPREGCPCDFGIECEDANPCTSHTCEDDLCVYAPAGGTSEGLACCADDAGCDDANPETLDRCDFGICWHGAFVCAGDADCATPDPCLEGACTAGQCTWTPVPGCCQVTAECDDGVPGTTDTCAGGACVHWFGAAPGCAADGDCPPSTPCKAIHCSTPSGLCTLSPTQGAGCCATAADCTEAAVCTTVSCDDLTCVEAPVFGADAFVTFDFDSGSLEGWQVEPDDSGALWQLHDVQAISAPWSLYYGKLPETNYDVGENFGFATTPEIVPPPGAVGLQVHFWFSADIEPGTKNDLFFLDLVQSGLATTVWDKGDSGGPGVGWKEAFVDLSPAPGPFALRFGFDSVDPISNGGDGIFVDDVEVLRACP